LNGRNPGFILPAAARLFGLSLGSRIVASPINAKCQVKKAQKSLGKFLSLFAARFRFVWYETFNTDERSR
jgi:hypothetical protein